MRKFVPKGTDIGKPEEKPNITIDPLYDPVPRENPRPIPSEPTPTRVPEREPDLVPA
jgi:hypothetical protein